MPPCPFARWRLISTYRFSRCCWTSSRACSLCNKEGLRVFSLLFNAMSRFTRSSFTWQWFPDVIWTSLNIIRRMIDLIRLENMPYLPITSRVRSHLCASFCRRTAPSGYRDAESSCGSPKCHRTREALRISNIQFTMKHCYRPCGWRNNNSPSTRGS